MPRPFSIIEVRREWAQDPEAMGTKEKFWYRGPGDDARWLFKYPRENTGEHWAEKIAAEVAALLGVPCAKVHLAKFEEHRGSVSQSFVSGETELVHGNQVLAWTISGYDPAKKRDQSDHTIENIWRALDEYMPEQAEAAKRQFAGYLILDAVIGNTDRHHENWGIVRRGERVCGLAPSFDHASALGRELLDETRARLVEEASVDRYAQKGRGHIYFRDDTEQRPRLLDLVREGIRDHRSYFDNVLEDLTALTDPAVANIVTRVPNGWMSESAKPFVKTLVSYNRNRLLNLAR